jgi:hypothetical protein
MHLSPTKVIAGWNDSDGCGVEEEAFRGLVFDIGGVSFSKAGSLR